MVQNRKSRATKEWEIEVAGSKQCYSWFDDVKGGFEFDKAENDKPYEKSKKFSCVSINRAPIYLKGFNRD